MDYLTVGTNDITRELLHDVSDRDDNYLKPCGGLWLSEHLGYKTYNAWMDYLLSHPSVFWLKNCFDNLWRQPCSLVKLKDDSNIFILDSEAKFAYLVNAYSRNNNFFSYQKLAFDYDGIYVDIAKLYKNMKNNNIANLISDYRLNTMLLFNLDCILYYSPGVVNIEPFDLDCYKLVDIYYEIEIDNIKKRVR